MPIIETKDNCTVIHPVEPDSGISQESVDNCVKIAKLNSLYRMLHNNCNDLNCCICNNTRSKSISNGSVNASIMFIDALPSEYETYTGCFTDNKGYLLEESLKDTKYNRTDLYCTTVIKCFDVSNLTSDIACACINNLFKREFDIVKPKKIIITSSAFQALLKYKVIKCNENINYFTKTITDFNDTKVELYVVYDMNNLNEQQKESFKQGLHYILQ